MKCGVCGQRYGDLLVKHGEVCDDDTKAQPTINDIKKAIDESDDEYEYEVESEDEDE
jgi:hypothetical protein